MNTLALVSVVLGSVALVACGDGGDKSPSGDKPATPPPAASPANPLPKGHILIDHILIGVKNAGNPEGKRSEADAKAFATRLMGELKSGADWAKAKRENSEDPPPGGPYQMADFRVAPMDVSPNDTSVLREFPRDGMVPAFGDVGFALAVGEIGLAEFNLQKSPFGFHIIKRLR